MSTQLANPVMLRYLDELEAGMPSRAAVAWADSFTTRVSRGQKSKANQHTGAVNPADVKNHGLLLLHTPSPHRDALFNGARRADNAAAYLHVGVRNHQFVSLPGFPAPSVKESREPRGDRISRGGHMEISISDPVLQYLASNPEPQKTYVTETVPAWVTENLSASTAEDYDNWLMELEKKVAKASLQARTTHNKTDAQVRRLTEQFGISVTSDAIEIISGAARNTCPPASLSQRLPGSFLQIRFAIASYLHLTGQSDHAALQEIYADLETDPEGPARRLLTEELKKLGVDQETISGIWAAVTLPAATQISVSPIQTRVLNTVINGAPMRTRDPKFYESKTWLRAAACIKKQLAAEQTQKLPAATIAPVNTRPNEIRWDANPNRNFESIGGIAS